MSKYNFNTGPHGDVCLKNERGLFNFGYNSTLKFFPTVWLYYRQITGDNLFGREEFILPPGDIELDSDWAQLLSEASDYSFSLPAASVKDFNSILLTLGLNHIISGNNAETHEWLLEEDGLLHLLSPKENPSLHLKAISLSREGTIPFLVDYLDFLQNESQMGTSYELACQTICRLAESP